MTDRMPRIAVIGEALVDIVHRADGGIEETPGGSPANTALALGRLGRRPTLITRLADDERGRRVQGWLADSEVDVVAFAAERTATAVAHLDPAGAASYEFDLQWDLGDDPARRERAVEGADLLHVGSVATVIEPGAGQVAELVRTVRERTLVSYDPNIRPSLVDDPQHVRERVADLVGLAHVVKASDEDIRWLHPGRDVVDVAREWVARGPRLVVVTLGSDGAVGVSAGRVTVVPGVTADVVDTVGAGDTFMGALLDGIAGDDELLTSLRTAGGGIRPDALGALLRRCAQAAAITVSRPGADPPRRAELPALALSAG